MRLSTVLGIFFICSAIAIACMALGIIPINKITQPGQFVLWLMVGLALVAAALSFSVQPTYWHYQVYAQFRDKPVLDSARRHDFKGFRSKKRATQMAINAMVDNKLEMFRHLIKVEPA